MNERTSGGIAEPLGSVVSPLMTVAARRVARRLRTEITHGAQFEVAAALLAAIALAVDRRRSDFVATLPNGTPPQLGHRLIEMLHAELLDSWAGGRSRTPASAILDALASLDQVRRALAPAVGYELGVGRSGPDPLELLVEVGHDLRSPLTAILFLAETLKRGQSGAVNELQQRQLRLIYSAALGLSGLVSDALELPRTGAELVDGEPSPLSLAELLESVGDIARPMAEEKGLRIDLTSAEPDSRLGHPQALTRVLLNLTTNALKFTDQGSVGISCAARGPARLEFAVRDTGPGITTEALENLYQPFRRARGRPGYCFSGTGLGLAICRKLVTAMGAELELETGGWGTRFYFELDLPVLSRR